MTRVDESERQQHYGDGRQPWDDICEATRIFHLAWRMNDTNGVRLR